ncbi:hypothetical protein [Sphingobium sp. MK2]|uniref:hypothetical protein n=1 Tax=Sphingobium sp. MK2 TaxID=3116540 RepID=UPI0032E35DDB
MDSEIMAAPVYADSREITAKDILYTAWSRGRDGKFWMEDTEPLAAALNKLIQQSISYGVQKSVKGFAASGVMPVNSLPTNQGARADLWIARLYGRPFRVTDCVLTHTQFQNGAPIDQLTWVSGMGSSFERHDPSRIVGWSIIPEWKEPA